MEGVAVVLEVIRVLAAFKDYNKAHKDQYWRTIKVVFVSLVFPH